MRISEAYSLPRQTIQIRSRDFRCRIVTSDIPVAQIIGEDEDNIRRGVRQGALNEQQGSSQAFENSHELPLPCPLQGLALKFPLVAISASDPGLGLRSPPLQSLFQAVANANDPEIRPFFDLGFAKRPQEELFYLPSDPDQIRNVASDPKFSQTL